jgi:hypothetical protein
MEVVDICLPSFFSFWEERQVGSVALDEAAIGVSQGIWFWLIADC